MAFVISLFRRSETRVVFEKGTKAGQKIILLIFNFKIAFVVFESHLQLYTLYGGRLRRDRLLPTAISVVGKSCFKSLDFIICWCIYIRIFWTIVTTIIGILYKVFKTPCHSLLRFNGLTYKDGYRSFVKVFEFLGKVRLNLNI